MKRSTFGAIVLGLVGVMTVTSIVYWKSTDSEVNDLQSMTRKKELIVRAPIPQGEDPETPDTAFYVFDNESWQDDQFYGSMNKIGVSNAIMIALPGHQTDFEWIRDRSADRLAFLQSQGQSVEDPAYTWKLSVVEYGIVNGQKRVVVNSALGKDIFYNGGIGSVGQKGITEIWEIREAQLPVLLERQQRDIPSGVHTQAEVNTRVEVPVIPPGTPLY